jgi:hypothetical protein
VLVGPVERYALQQKLDGQRAGLAALDDGHGWSPHISHPLLSEPV